MNVKHILIFSVLISLSLNILAQTVRSKHAIQIEQYIINEEYDKAIDYKKESHKKLDGESVYLKGVAHYLNAMDRKAIELFEIASEKGYSNVNLYMYKAWAQFEIHEFYDAISSLEQAQKIDPANTEIYTGKGIMYYNLKLREEALEEFNYATLLGDTDPSIYEYMGQINMELKDYNSAISNYKNAMKSYEEGSKDYKDNYYNMALCQQLLGNYKDAEESFTKYLILYPDDYQAQTKLLQSFYALEKYDKAKIIEEQLINAYQENKLPLHLMEMYCFHQFKWNNYNIMAFKAYEKYEGEPVIWMHRFFLLDEEEEILIKIETQLDSLDSTSELEKYLLCKIENDTIYRYSNLNIDKNTEYKLLLEAVLDILNKNVKHDSKMGEYSTWLVHQKEIMLFGAGTSYKKAVKVNSIAEEYNWLSKNYPKYKMVQQSLVFEDGVPYDILEIITKEGVRKKVYFNISNFYGKGF